MPLPSVSQFGAQRCQCLCKRTRLPCQNPAAFDTRACRMHGAHRSRAALSGVDHPNYRHGEETLGAKSARSKASAKLRLLEQLGSALGMFVGTRAPRRESHE